VHSPAGPSMAAAARHHELNQGQAHTCSHTDIALQPAAIQTLPYNSCCQQLPLPSLAVPGLLATEVHQDGCTNFDIGVQCLEIHPNHVHVLGMLHKHSSCGRNALDLVLQVVCLPAKVQVDERDLIHGQVLDGGQQLGRQPDQEGHGGRQVVSEGAWQQRQEDVVPPAMQAAQQQSGCRTRLCKTLRELQACSRPVTQNSPRPCWPLNTW